MQGLKANISKTSYPTMPLKAALNTDVNAKRGWWMNGRLKVK